MPVSTAAGTTNTRGKPPAHPSTNSAPRIAHAQLPLLPLQQTTQQLPLLPPPPSSLPTAPASGGVGQVETLPKSQTAHCKHCEEFGIKGGAGGGGNGGSIYWRLHLDRDLLETIISIYPEWFKDCNVSPGAMAEGGPCGLGASPTPPSSPSSSAASNSSGGLRRKSVSSASAAAGAAAASAAASSSSSSPPPHSPPKAQVDDSPLQKSMDRNKESLKVKLMLRRPINQLVAQGIMPPLKTPPAFHEQRQKLERAKTGDLLKAKIQQRPNRTELVRQHILEADMGHVDPSLAERQRMLKKARLQDTLNDQLSHRPGPLELIQKNILHTEEIIERAVKEGQISFKATCEGHLSRPQHPSHYVTFEEDSGGSSEGAASSPPSSQTVVSTVPPETSVPHSPGLASTTSSLSPLSSVSSPQSVAPPAPLPPPPPPPTLPTPPPPLRSTPISTPIPQSSLQGSVNALQQTPNLSPSSTSASVLSSSLTQVTASPISAVLSAQKEQVSSSSSSKNRKKSKTKSQPKTRTIKFHEYKGPPNAQRNSSSLISPPPVETSYELLLQQQQLFLQWQLEWQHKYPQIILPAAQKPSDVGLITVTTPSTTSTSGSITLASSSAPPPTPPPQPPPSTTPIFLQAHSPGFSASQGSISAASSPAAPTTIATNTSSVSSTSVSASLTSTSAPSPKDVAALRCLPPKMEDMKVSDLKAELKKRNLPVSGSKPQLIERLRAYAEAAPSAGSSTCVQMGSPPTPSPGTPSAPPPPPPPPLPPPPQLSAHSPFSSATTPQHSVFGVDSNIEDSLPGLHMDSPVVSPSGTSMDALPSPSSSPPPGSLYIQNKGTGASGQMTLQVFSPASEMEVDPEAAVVVILAQPTDSAGSPPAQISSPSPLMKQGPSSPPVSSSPPLRPPPPPPPLPPPPQQTSNVQTSSTQGATEGNVIIGNDIIAQQQKKIEELQRELLRSQFQLQCERQKEQRQLLMQQQLATQSQQRPGGTGNAAPTASSANDLKPTHRLVLQQHLQNKIQQQQLQVQLQHLQNMQLQQKQQQLQLQQQQKQKQMSASKLACQQAQQQLQQSQASAKASLAAFLQQQNSTTTANNNNVTQAANNNNNNNNNLKKGANSQQQQKVVLNQLNLLNKAAKAGLLTASGNKSVSGTAPNGVTGHHRTASLPNFFGTTFGSPKSTQQQVPLQTAQLSPQQIQQQATVVSSGSETPKGMEGVEGGLGSIDSIGIDMSPTSALQSPSTPSPAPSPAPSPQQFLITKLPPHYEEATKLLKVKMEPGTNSSSPGGGTNEPASPRNASNKSVKSQIVDDVLEILIKNGELPPSAANDPATPTTPGRNLPHGLIFTTTATTTATTQSPASLSSVSMVHQPVTQSQSSFPSLILAEVKTEEISDKHVPSTDSQHLFHPFDFVLGADTSPTPLHRVASQEANSHREDHSSHELLPLQQTDDLGLDLEALDVMEFDLLGGPPAPPPVSHIEMGPVSPVTPDGRGMDHITDTHLHNSIPRDEDVDMEAVVGSGAGGELSEMPMDLDVSDWLDSLIAPAGNSQNGGASPFHHQSLPQPPQYDPLLSHSHDPFDLFDDAELRMASWDRVDFAA